jgi:hypothetical protein
MSRNHEAPGDGESAINDLDKFISEDLPKAIGSILRSTPKQLQREKGPKNLQSTIDYLRHFLTTLDTTTKNGRGVAGRIDAKIIELDRVLKEIHDKGAGEKNEEDRDKTFDHPVQIPEKKVEQPQKLVKSKKVVDEAQKLAKQKTSAEYAEKARLDKVKALFHVADRVKIDDLAALLKMERTDLMERLISWSKDISFKISGDEIVISGEASDKLVSELDRQFASWNTKETKKDGKI